MFLLIFFASTAIGISFLCSVMEAALLSITPSFIAQLEEKNPKWFKQVNAIGRCRRPGYACAKLILAFARIMDLRILVLKPSGRIVLLRLLYIQFMGMFGSAEDASGTL